MPMPMEELPPPPQEGYDPKLQEVVPLGVEELTAAAEAAADAANELNAAQASDAGVSVDDPQLNEGEGMTPAPVGMESMPAFELNGDSEPAPVDHNQQQPPAEQAGAEDAALFHLQVEQQYKTEEGYRIPEEQEYTQDEQYNQEQQYTSTSVPVPPMMDDWNQHQEEPAPDAPPAPPANPMNTTMELHSPIVAAAPVPIQAPEPAPLPPTMEHHPAGSEPMYASYAIAPPGHPAHAAAAVPPPPAGHMHHYDPYAHYPHNPYHMPPTYAPPPKPSHQQGNHNSNFWLQEEEERFLLGLRLYGWGQWKRIQSVVQTRSNKQIKSHAQKREKVNPEIKYKYAKNKSRRGRISSKIIAPDYPVAEAQTDNNDPRLPPMEELWKDVYGTNNGVGPNSRLRRYRSNALHQKWLEEVAEKPEAEQAAALQVATEKKVKAGVDAKTEKGKKKTTPEGQYLMEHKILERHAAMPPHPSPPVPYNLPPGHYYPPPHLPQGHHYPPQPGYYPPPGQPYYPHPPGVSPPRMHPSSYPPQPHGHATPATHPPIIHHPAATPGTDEEPLRPGMRVYARNKGSGSWSPGVIYSAKVDPNKTLDANQASVPLVYHVQYDAGEEDPEVQEEYIIGKSMYEKAIDALEAHYNLPPSTRSPAPLEAGLPVYAQWIEKSNPTLHARWLPGTIGSVQTEQSPTGLLCTYHILFDNTLEKTVPQTHVLERNEYHELFKANSTNINPLDPPPIVEIYGMFSRGDQVGTSGQGMDLLFTASQMAAPMDMKKRGAEAVADPTAGGEAKKRKTEEVEENTGAPNEEEGEAFIV